METLRFAMVLLLLVFVQVWGTLGTPVSSEEGRRDAWTEEDRQGYPLQRGLSLRLADLVKRSQQFHGLMGRSPESEAPQAPQPGRLGRKSEIHYRNKGNKGEMFVGLMGRRSSGGGEEDGDVEWRSDFY